MRQYLATLHERSDHHKKRFAFVASASFTLAIFAVWSFVNFGLPGQALPDTQNKVVAQDKKESSSFEPLKNGVAAAFKAIGGTVDEAKQGLEQVDIEGEYDRMRDRAFDTYGR
jgi:hypothetical protein